MFTFEGSAVFFVFQVYTCMVLVLSKNCDMTMFDPSGSFSSHTSGDYYEHNRDCSFTIEVPVGHGIKLIWESFDIRGQMPLCTNQDYVEVFVGCSPQTIGRFCSDNSDFPHDIYSPDKCLKVVFHSNDQDNGRGFSARYESVDLSRALSSISGCGRTDLQGDSGVIYSPSWPLSYPPTKECTWEISVGSKDHVKISFMEFNLQTSSFCGSHDDHVEIRGGDVNEYYYKATKVQDRICGKRMPFYLTTSHSKVFVRFKSDSFTEARGFIAGYVVYKPKQTDDIFMLSIVIGVLVSFAVLACCIGVCCFYRRQTRKRKRRSSHRGRAQPAPQRQRYSSEQGEPIQPENTSVIPDHTTGPPPPYTVTPEHASPSLLQTTGLSYPSTAAHPPMYSGFIAPPAHNPLYPIRQDPIQQNPISQDPIHQEHPIVPNETAPPYQLSGHAYPHLLEPPPYTTLPRPT